MLASTDHLNEHINETHVFCVRSLGKVYQSFASSYFNVNALCQNNVFRVIGGGEFLRCFLFENKKSKLFVTQKVIISF